MPKPIIEANAEELNAEAFQAEEVRTMQGAGIPDDFIPESAVAPAAASQAKEEVETETEEQRVPYSRFKKVLDEKVEAERAAEEARGFSTTVLERLTAIEQSVREGSQRPSEDLSSASWKAWEKLYGDTDESREAFRLNQEFLTEARKEAIEEARKSALDEVRKEREAVAKRESDFEKFVENGFTELEKQLGRTLSESDRDAILQTADHFTPKDAQGNYTSNLYPLSMAHEMWELQKSKTTSRQSKERNEIASLVRADTAGDTSSRNRPRNDPRDFGGWRKVLGIN